MPLLQHFSTPHMGTQHTPEARKHFRLKRQVPEGGCSWRVLWGPVHQSCL